MLLETKLTRDVVDAMVTASVAVIQAAGAEPRERLVAAILDDCDAVEPGLRVALAIAFSSDGLSAKERAVIDGIANAAHVPKETVDRLVKEVGAFASEGDPTSTRMSLLPG